MFECRACVVRSIRAIAGDALHAQSLNRSRQPLLLTPHLTPPVRRAASTAVADKEPAHDELAPVAQSNEGDAFGGDVPRSRKALAMSDAKALRTEMKYLSDPLKLAEHVRYTLRCNKPEKALDLCRLASKHQEVLVSWNHCVDWHMQHNRIDEAIKIYNEMKKRAQFPDSYTYTLLLRGLSKSHHHGEVVKQTNVVKAMSIYNSMSSPTSRVKPSIYHTNATLKVCSAALDMDSLWSVAAKLPTRGHGAPDRMTYAILLHAIRHGAMGSNPEESPLDQIATRRREAVNQGRRIWGEIISKWRAGEVQIDEELVCAMGRLLLISKSMRDWDDVLNLVQQTMNIERQVAPLGSAERHTEHIRQELDAPSAAGEASEDADGYSDVPSTKAFFPVTPLPPDSLQPKRPQTLAYVTPGNPTLSMLIGTCAELRTPKTANVYWDILTSDDGSYRLHADRPNFHAYFRLLGVNRSSAKAVAVLQSMPENGVIPKNMTFRIVMSICIRDKNNHNVLQHARAVVDEMEKHCPDPDLHTLIQYLNLALNTDDGQKIVAALDRLEPIAHGLRSRVSYGSDEYKSPVAETQDKKEILAFFQAIIGVIDTLMHRGLVPQSEFKHWHARRGKLIQFIGKARGRVERLASEADGRKQALVGKQREREWRGAMDKKEHSGLRMSKTEYALKQLKWRERRKREVERERQRAIGLKSWDGRRDRRVFPGPGVDEGGEGEGFADSPMELGMR